ncbi:MAG TPA: DUF1385 domain-containing protein [Thermomicrobiales bacterium]|nr:DUF1385 domain-containing protein [Thermomicrobiales bacterium]
MAKPFYYGGQAVMEGVMMRGRSSMAVAVRAPDGRIVLYEEALQPGPVLRAVRNVPFVRGAIVLWDTLLLGMRALIFSANVGLQEQATDEDGKPREEPQLLAGPLLWLTVSISLLFSIALFFVMPLAVIGFLDRWIESDFVSNVIEGGIRLGVLIGYMALIGQMNDIRRVFGYHGAEHMTINAYEAGSPIDVQHARAASITHIRCGTGFLLIVVLMSIFVFAMLGRPDWIWRVGSRIVLVPFIAALAYEVIRFGARHAEHVVTRVILAPGLALQSVTTRAPEDGMLEVAIAAFKRVLATDAVIPESELDPAIVVVDTSGRPLVRTPELEPVLT